MALFLWVGSELDQIIEHLSKLLESLVRYHYINQHLRSLGGLGNRKQQVPEISLT